MGSSRIEELSPRGRECLSGVHRGLTSKEIALELGIAEGTVTGYIRDSVALLGAPNRRAAARMVFGDPQIFEGRSIGLGEDAATDAPEPQGAAASPWGGFLDVANRGVDNDLGFFARIFAVVLLAVGFAGGFGILAAAVRTVSDLVGRIGHG